MKKFLIGFVVVLGLTVAAFRLDMPPTRLFGGQFILVFEGPITNNMFVTEDTDAFNPGLPVGARFPAIRALYRGQEITSIEQFVADRGAVFVAVRSADW